MEETDFPPQASDDAPPNADDAAQAPPAAAAPPSPPASAPTVPALPRHRFEFHGDAREFFRIWIVNLALSVVTLGIFSAWAKVRTQRYFYSHTRVGGVPFEYLARPLPILKGRLIAYALFGAYVLAGQFSIRLQLGLLALIALVAPWLIVRGLMFHARYSSWRGLTFRFQPNYKGAYGWFLLAYLLVPISIGLAYPYVKFAQKRFLVTEHRFGGKAFRFLAGSGDFYPPYLISIAIVFGWVVACTMLLGPMLAHGRLGLWAIYAYTAVIYFGYFIAFAYTTSRITNLVYNQAALDDNRLHSTIGAGDLMRLYLSNAVMILVTAGMAVPWAQVRMARYRAEHLELEAGELDGFVAEAQRDESAFGAEMDSVFDLDIGL